MWWSLLRATQIIGRWMKEPLLFACLPSLLQASSSILLLLLRPFTDVRTSSFQLPTKTEVQQFSNNPPVLLLRIGTEETSSSVD